MSVFVADVSVSFDSRIVLDGVTATFPSATMSAVMGPSGAGKSTLLGVIGGYIRPERGEVTFGGSASTERQAFVFQSSSVIPWRTALDNVALGGLSRGATHAQAADEALGLLSRLGLASEAMRRGYQLSGGERQRVGVLRALASGARVILADEPTASLDALSRADVIAALEVAAAEGATVIICTHDLAVADACSRTFRLWD